MKVSSFSNDHPTALIRGWVDATAATGAGIGRVMQSYLNNTGAALAVGDVVVMDSSADVAVTTTTTAQDTRIVGIVQDTIAAGAVGPVLTGGFAAFVNVTASVTRGYYAETSTTAKKATENITRRSGSFGIFLSAGTTPAALLFGGGDAVGASGNAGGSGVASSLNTITPAQITANTDNWNPTGLATADVIRASTDATWNLTGIVAPAATRLLIIENIDATDLILQHDISSANANRFYCPGDDDVTLVVDSACLLIYDVTSSRWRVIAITGGGAGSGAPTTAQYLTGAPDGGLSAEKVKAALYRNYDPDEYPAADNAVSDEFDDSSLDGAWSWDSAPSATVSESAFPGFLHLDGGTNNAAAVRYLTRAYTPGATAFTVVAKVSIALENGNYSGAIGIALRSSVPADIWVIDIATDGTSTASDSHRILATSGSMTPGDQLNDGWYYLMLTRDASNVYNAYFSRNGLTWQWIGGSTVATTVARVGLLYSADTDSKEAQGAVDFVRVFDSITKVIGA
jgi:hypothetical protein